jgi:hypothetical protein
VNLVAVERHSFQLLIALRTLLSNPVCQVAFTREYRSCLFPISPFSQQVRPTCQSGDPRKPAQEEEREQPFASVRMAGFSHSPQRPNPANPHGPPTLLPRGSYQRQGQWGQAVSFGGQPQGLVPQAFVQPQSVAQNQNLAPNQGYGQGEGFRPSFGQAPQASGHVQSFGQAPQGLVQGPGHVQGFGQLLALGQGKSLGPQGHFSGSFQQGQSPQSTLGIGQVLLVQPVAVAQPSPLNPGTLSKPGCLWNRLF